LINHKLLYISDTALPHVLKKERGAFCISVFVGTIGPSDSANSAAKKTSERREIMAGILKEYGVHLKVDGKSPRTMESYLGDVQEFLDYLSLEGVYNAAVIQRQHVTAFRSQLLSRELKPATINKKVNSLACFCAWLHKEVAERFCKELAEERESLKNGDLKKWVNDPYTIYRTTFCSFSGYMV